MAEFNKTWLKYTMIRIVRQMAWTGIAVLGSAQLIEEVNWRFFVSALLLSAIANFLACLAGIPEADEPYKEDREPIFYEDDDDGESGV